MATIQVSTRYRRCYRVRKLNSFGNNLKTFGLQMKDSVHAVSLKGSVPNENIDGYWFQTMCIFRYSKRLNVLGKLSPLSEVFVKSALISGDSFRLGGSRIIGLKLQLEALGCAVWKGEGVGRAAAAELGLRSRAVKSSCELSGVGRCSWPAGSQARESLVWELTVDHKSVAIRRLSLLQSY
ncbi:hypothetical protein LSTR_LSTR010803 [Laodelphax striatellus]|uniref:Uncharacterized protein n=1 Tax=Laodelphax striatellus TaxID=195883 RepID=A0A482X780_LAOST|nr:hypothetical protein LSTR_LSTR010803 [Laodelphax striatellus]